VLKSVGRDAAPRTNELEEPTLADQIPADAFRRAVLPLLDEVMATVHGDALVQ
jgi:hypothetical protein